ncbi:MAG TPA: tRNA (N(6)-L-threonylcarbamoyladenosine(37)-C(2))-methylthiotransferase MtaB [Bacilli bacterium]|nr:tRNA (N(6)-L-threonylcarbamoyladenosine(37)-C(2))-methylthiotransferase MtaB [Bacilli bacterium]HQC83575.1 tRNA (N(6)-L-threonylcarbamoyladenosine(37)-C(2))-methylthiotransferase MtaB [Bacilli bacterium]
MNVCIITLGCKVNTYESESLKEAFERAGYKIIDDEKKADVIVINTCTVTNQADAKSRKLIRSARRNNKDALLCVCGCSAQHNKGAWIDLDIDILMGNGSKLKLVDYVKNYKNEKIRDFIDIRTSTFENMNINNFEERTRGFVKIQDGCNNFCSYCIIPFVRGNIRSKDIDTAEEEINCLANNGYQEIVLTGIHTGSYGDGEDFDLVDLIRRVSKNPNLKRIRISSIEITELDEKFMDELKNNSKLCDHMHVPIQAGSNHVLKLMNRKYNLEEYKAKINELRSIRPDINITTDLIVGFPEETDEDFEDSLKTAREVGFSKIHTFPYSLRDGTKAATLKQVNDTVKTNRTKRMLELSDELESVYYKKFIGKTIPVLVEANNQGMSSNYIKVHLDTLCDHNTFVNVLITDVDGTNVKGHVIK